MRRFAAEWAGHYERLDSGEKAAREFLLLRRQSFVSPRGFSRGRRLALDLPRGYDVELAHRLIGPDFRPYICLARKAPRRA